MDSLIEKQKTLKNRYKTLKHTVAVRVYDDILNDKKVDSVEEQLHYFLTEAAEIFMFMSPFAFKLVDSGDGALSDG